MKTACARLTYRVGNSLNKISQSVYILNHQIHMFWTDTHGLLITPWDAVTSNSFFHDKGKASLIDESVKTTIYQIWSVWECQILSSVQISHSWLQKFRQKDWPVWQMSWEWLALLILSKQKQKLELDSAMG